MNRQYRKKEKGWRKARSGDRSVAGGRGARSTRVDLEDEKPTHRPYGREVARRPRTGWTFVLINNAAALDPPIRSS